LKFKRENQNAKHGQQKGDKTKSNIPLSVQTTKREKCAIDNEQKVTETGKTGQ
jgi:hypothetical protein